MTSLNQIYRDYFYDPDLPGADIEDLSYGGNTLFELKCGYWVTIKGVSRADGRHDYVVFANGQEVGLVRNFRNDADVYTGRFEEI